MKKLLLIFLIISVVAVGCQNQPSVAPRIAPSDAAVSQSVDTYFIDGSLKDNAFTATQKVNYVNKEQDILKELYFHLYPNMYKENKSPDGAFTKSAYPNGFSKGEIELYEVSLLGIPLSTETKGNHLKINLPTPLEPMNSVIITFKYKTVLPNALCRMGYFNDCYNLTGFYPVAVVYDNGWRLDQYNDLGDPFFTDISDYRVTLRLPQGFTVASTGEQQKYYNDNEQVVKTTANNVREVAFVASPHLQVFETTVDGITVSSYAKDKTYGEKALEHGKNALTFYNGYFGKYPYSRFSIVDSEYFSGGMEYPNLVLISDSLYNENSLTDLEWVVAHETAHQWWYGVVGSDPVNDAYVDESLTEFSTLLYARSIHDEKTFTDLKNRYILSPYAKYKHLVQGKVHKPITEFKSAVDVSMLVYIKGCMMYMDMENIMGKEKLQETLRNYYEQHAYGIASSKNLQDAVKSSFNYDWDAFFKKWLYSNKV